MLSSFQPEQIVLGIFFYKILINEGDGFLIRQKSLPFERNFTNFLEFRHGNRCGMRWRDVLVKQFFFCK